MFVNNYLDNFKTILPFAIVPQKELLINCNPNSVDLRKYSQLTMEVLCIYINNIIFT